MTIPRRIVNFFLTGGKVLRRGAELPLLSSSATPVIIYITSGKTVMEDIFILRIEYCVDGDKYKAKS